MTNGEFLPHANPASATMRATTGQAISIRYDAAANAIVFLEEDWFADTFRAGSVPPRSQFRKRVGTDVVVKLKSRPRLASRGPQAA